MEIEGEIEGEGKNVWMLKPNMVLVRVRDLKL